jgi:hypothetical protein
MSAEPSPLHDMTPGIMYSVRGCNTLLCTQCACVACKRVLGRRVAQKGHIHYRIFSLPTSNLDSYFSFPNLNFLIINFQFGYFSLPISSFFIFIIIVDITFGYLCGYSELSLYACAHGKQEQLDSLCMMCPTI